MYLELFDALENENPLYTGFFNSVDTNPAIVHISGLIEQIETMLASDLSDEKKEKFCRFIISRFDNKTIYKNDFHAPPKDEFARSSVEMMKERIREAKAKLAAQPSDYYATAAIYIDQCAIDAIEKQPWGPKALGQLISPKEEEKRAMGRHGMAASFRIVPHTEGRICFVVTRSLSPILGQGSIRSYSDKTRIYGVFDYLTLMGIHKSAGLISSEHAEKYRRKCLGLLITWEDMKGNFGYEQVIETSNLNRGILQFLPSGYNQGRYVRAGTVALSDLLSSNVGINEYFVALMLVRLEMDQFAQLIRLLSGREFDQEDLRGFMDDLLEERRRGKKDLGKMPDPWRKNIAEGKKSLKRKKRNKSKKSKKSSDLSIDLRGVQEQSPILRQDTSQYQGVTYEKQRNKWQARIRIDGEHYIIGRYASEEEAGAVYATVLARYRGRETPDIIDFDLRGVLLQLPIPRSDVSSKYQGVSFHKANNKWWAQIRIKGSNHSLGFYDIEEEAAQAYAKAVFKYR